VLHFAPEDLISLKLQRIAAYYATADLLRSNHDLRLDMSDMRQVENASYDAVIALDVLEHVPDYRRALREVHRVLCPTGWGIFTVPQKDGLTATYEDSSVATSKDREEHFGQWDHLRIFGDDFPIILQAAGFTVTSVDASWFSRGLVERHVLSPPLISTHSLATNHRRVFFCQKA